MFKYIDEQIKKYDSIVIFGHVIPDGDCYGSQIALKNVIKLAYPNKRVYVTGSGYHRFFKMLGAMDEVDDETIKNSLAILVDSNDLLRSEDQRISSAKAWVKLDHHVDVGTFTQGEFVVNEDANSTCEIIVDMIQELNYPMNSVVANALYLGILTDSGRFQFIKDFPKSFAQASWLCQNGANPKELNRILNITDETLLAFKGYVFSNYQKTEAGTVYFVIDKETLKSLNITANKAGNMVNLISNLSGYPVWAFFVEDEDGSAHAELRSNGPAVQPIALKHGGGGHLQAAGFPIAKFDRNLILDYVKEIDEIVISWKQRKNKQVERPIFL